MTGFAGFAVESTVCCAVEVVDFGGRPRGPFGFCCLVFVLVCLDINSPSLLSSPEGKKGTIMADVWLRPFNTGVKILGSKAYLPWEVFSLRDFLFVVLQIQEIRIRRLSSVFVSLSVSTYLLICYSLSVAQPFSALFCLVVLI